MSARAMSLKDRIKNYAKSNNIAAQVVLQNYMFERFLERLSKSEYCQRFVIKGGMLIAAIVGLDTRATMDLDATLNNIPLTEKEILKAINIICAVKLDDDVSFQVQSVMPIRKNDKYGGFCVRLDASYDTIVTPLSIDISVGDVITPSAVQYEFSGIFDENVRIRLWGYNIETVLAEKMETILSRGIFNTRPRDFYDVYILATTQKYSPQILQSALVETSRHRSSTELISAPDRILRQIEASNDLKEMWRKYQNKFAYARDISFDDIIEILHKLIAQK